MNLRPGRPHDARPTNAGLRITAKDRIRIDTQRRKWRPNESLDSTVAVTVDSALGLAQASTSTLASALALVAESTDVLEVGHEKKVP